MKQRIGYSLCQSCYTVKMAIPSNSIFHTPTPHQAPNPNSYGRALLSVPPQAIAPNPHTSLLNVYIQLANKMGFQQKQKTKQNKCLTHQLYNKLTFL
jgi:hypothetical protein